MYFISKSLFSIKLKYPCSPLKTLFGPGKPAIVKSIEPKAALALKPTWSPNIGTPSTCDCIFPHVCEYIIPRALLISVDENFCILDKAATAPKPLAVAGLKNFNSPLAQIPKYEAMSTPRARDNKNSLPSMKRPFLFSLSQWESIELKIAAIGWTTAPSWIQSNSKQWIWYAFIKVAASLEYFSQVPKIEQSFPWDHVFATFFSSVNFEPVLPAIPTPIESNKNTLILCTVSSFKSSKLACSICFENNSAASNSIINSYQTILNF